MTVLVSKAIQQIWMAWEGFMDQVTKIRSKCVKDYGICKLVLRRYRGKSLICQDGQQIHAGDWIGELHLDNRQVLQLSREVGADRAGLLTARKLRKSMKLISEALQNDPELSQVKALTGITLLHRGIIHGLGFEVHPLESKGTRWIVTRYLRLLRRALHPDGFLSADSNEQKLVPRMLLLSRGVLVAKYHFS